jgi:hypothetical protein
MIIIPPIGSFSGSAASFFFFSFLVITFYLGNGSSSVHWQRPVHVSSWKGGRRVFLLLWHYSRIVVDNAKRTWREERERGFVLEGNVLVEFHLSISFFAIFFFFFVLTLLRIEHLSSLELVTAPIFSTWVS